MHYEICIPSDNTSEHSHLSFLYIIDDCVSHTPTLFHLHVNFVVLFHYVK